MHKIKNIINNMATKNFKGFQLVTKARFEALGTNKDKDTKEKKYH